MRVSLRALVRQRRQDPPNTQALVPPLKLYREIKRAHRNLPTEQRQLGDQYVTSEFKAHKSVDNPLHIVGFLTSWQEYLAMVSKNTTDDWRKYQLKPTDLQKMSDEQVGQLYELMNETKNFHQNQMNSNEGGEGDGKN